MAFFTRLAEDTSDTSRPVLQRDAMLMLANGGAKFLFDFLDPYCNPNADGAIGGASFLNLVSGGAAAHVAGVISNLTSKAGLSFTSGSQSNGVALAATDYDLSGSGHSFYVEIWAKEVASGYNATAYHTLFGYTTGSNNDAQWIFDMGSDGKSPRGSVATTTGGAGAITVTGSSGVMLGAVTQLGLAWAPGTISMFVNGVLIGSASSTQINTVKSGGAATPYINGAFKGTIYRVYEEDLTVSANAAAAVAANSYALNSARFT